MMGILRVGVSGRVLSQPEAEAEGIVQEQEQGQPSLIRTLASQPAQRSSFCYAFNDRFESGWWGGEEWNQSSLCASCWNFVVLFAYRYIFLESLSNTRSTVIL